MWDFLSNQLCRAGIPGKAQTLSINPNIIWITWLGYHDDDCIVTNAIEMVFNWTGIHCNAGG